VSDAGAGSKIIARCASCEDATFPKFFPIFTNGKGGEGEGDKKISCDTPNGDYVLVLPQAPGGSQVVDVCEIDAGGDVACVCQVEISELAYKWKSRLNYKLHHSTALKIRNYDGYEPSERAWVDISDVIPDKQIGIFRGIARIPEDRIGAIGLSCAVDLSDVAGGTATCDDAGAVATGDEGDAASGGAAGNAMGSAIILKDKCRTSPRDKNVRYREFEFSIRAPLGAGRYTFKVSVEGEQLDGGLVLLKDEVEAMLYNSRKYVINAQNDPEYDGWFARHKISVQEANEQRFAMLSCEPAFSIVVVLRDLNRVDFAAMVESVVNQTYPVWQLVLVDSGCLCEELAIEVAALAQKESRAVAVKADRTSASAESDAEALNCGLAASVGDFVCFLNQGDTLEPDCLFEYVRTVCDYSDCDIIYCDEDILRPDGAYTAPFFKPCYSPAQLEARNYFGNLLCIRKSLVDEVGGIYPGYDCAQMYDLTLRASEKARKIEHVARVLYHNRVTAGDEATDAQFDVDRASDVAQTDDEVRALQAHLNRLGVKAVVRQGALPHAYTLDYRDMFASGDAPRVSVVIPSKDASGMLKDCVDSIYALGGYSNLEVIAVENNSVEPDTFAMYKYLESTYGTFKVVTWDKGEGFNFSSIVNYGVEVARGELVLLLNNDTKAITKGWIAQLVGDVLREGVGAVGVKLYYADDTVQHAGVVVANECAAHINLSLPRDCEGYFGSALVAQNFSAVTAACVMVRRDAYEQVGGFDKTLAVAFNDVDFCLSLRAAGYEVVFDPSVELYHFESVSRGYEDTEEKAQRFAREVDYLSDKWRSFYKAGDPYINQNFVEKNAFNLHYSLLKDDGIKASR
jgi:GT2 family glycosyltransferase